MAQAKAENSGKHLNGETEENKGAPSSIFKLLIARLFFSSGSPPTPAFICMCATRKKTEQSREWGLLLLLTFLAGSGAAAVTGVVDSCAVDDRSGAIANELDCDYKSANRKRGATKQKGGNSVKFLP